MDTVSGTRWSVGRVAAMLVVAAFVAMWAFIFSRTGREDVPDELDDLSFAEAAQPRCETTTAEIDAVEPAESRSARAEQLEEANVRLGRLVDELRRLAPENGHDGDLVGAWLDDWDTYLADREAYVEALRAEGEDAEFLVTPRAGRQITVTMERFAEINDMPACAPPADV